MVVKSGFNSVFNSVRTDLFCDSWPRESKRRPGVLFMSGTVEAYAGVTWQWVDANVLILKTHFLFLQPCSVSDQQGDRKHTASLAQAQSPSSLPPVWLTLHQIARPWSLRECCWGCWKRTRARQSLWGHKGRGMDGDGEGWTNRRTKVEEGPLVKTVEILWLEQRSRSY